MFTQLYVREDDYQGPVEIIGLEDGSVYLSARERVAALTISDARAVRDVLTAHLAGYPEPDPEPVAA